MCKCVRLISEIFKITKMYILVREGCDLEAQTAIHLFPLFLYSGIQTLLHIGEVWGGFGGIPTESQM